MIPGRQHIPLSLAAPLPVGGVTGTRVPGTVMRSCSLGSNCCYGPNMAEAWQNVFPHRWFARIGCVRRVGDGVQTCAE